MNQRPRNHEKSACLPSGSLGVIFAFAVALTNHAAFAGDVFAPSAPPTPDQARCNAIGEGFYAVKGSNACIKISGYIAAGARLGTDEQIGGHTSPFGPLDAPEFVGSVRPSRATVIEVPADQDRLFRSPGSGDEAR